MKFSVQSVMLRSIDGTRPSCITTEPEEACWLMSMMVLDALLSIGDESDSQEIGNIENLGGCT